MGDDTLKAMEAAEATARAALERHLAPATDEGRAYALPLLLGSALNRSDDQVRELAEGWLTANPTAVRGDNVILRHMRGVVGAMNRGMGKR